jgi:hypothetical protein
MPETSLFTCGIMAETNSLSDLASQLRRSEVTIDERFKQLKRLLNITADGLEDHVADAPLCNVQYVHIFIDAASFPVSVAWLKMCISSLNHALVCWRARPKPREPDRL